MTQQFTASEVRNWERAYKGTGAAEVFDAFADILEAREKAVPVMVVNHVSSAEHDLPIGMKLYAHPAPSDAERLAEALHSIGERLSSVLCDPSGEVVVRGSDGDRQVLTQALKDLGELAAHSAQAQPPAASVPDGLVDALRHQRQIDEDGAEVGVSRQAVDEAANILAMLAAQENPDG